MLKYFSAVKEGDQKDHLPRVLRQERAKVRKRSNWLNLQLDL